MASSINKPSLPISEFRLKTMLEAEDKQSATKLSLWDQFKDYFRNLFGQETKRAKVEAFYKTMVQEFPRLQSAEGKFYLNPEIKKLLIFAKISAMADVDKWKEFKIAVQDGHATFSIGDKPVYQCQLCEKEANFITEQGTWADGRVKTRQEILDAIFTDREQFARLNEQNPRNKQAEQLQSVARIKATDQQQNAAAKLIQAAVRQHQTNQEVLIDEAKRKGLNYAAKKYRGNNPQALKGPVDFWVNTQKQGPVLHTPVHPPAHPASGGFKKLYAQDKSLVALVPKKGGKDFSAEAKKDNSDLAALNLPTVKYGVVVD